MHITQRRSQMKSFTVIVLFWNLRVRVHIKRRNTHKHISGLLVSIVDNGILDQNFLTSILGIKAISLTTIGLNNISWQQIGDSKFDAPFERLTLNNVQNMPEVRHQLPGRQGEQGHEWPLQRIKRPFESYLERILIPDVKPLRTQSLRPIRCRPNQEVRPRIEK